MIPCALYGFLGELRSQRNTGGGQNLLLYRERFYRERYMGLMLLTDDRRSSAKRSAAR